MTPCEQGDLVSEYTESDVDTLSSDVIKAELPCLRKVRSKTARKRIVEKSTEDENGVEKDCLAPEIMSSLGSLTDEMDFQTLNSDCNKVMLWTKLKPHIFKFIIKQARLKSNDKAMVFTN